MTLAALVLLAGPEPTAAYLRRYTCSSCSRVDTGGTPGPRLLHGKPGGYTCASGLWFCSSCSRALWEAHLGALRVLGARLDRLGRYKRRELPWQKPAPAWWPDGLPQRAELAEVG